MKVLYANPIFLDYRLPFYEELNKHFEGNFYIMYSENRYIGRYDSLLKRIKNEMKDNAIPFKGEHLFDTATMSFKRVEIEHGQKIPFLHGFLRTIRKYKPDVLITEGFFQWTPMVILYSLLYKIPVFMGYERTMHTERNCNLIKKIHRKLTDKFITGYLVNGIETERYLLSLGVKPEKIKIGGMSADGSGLSERIKKIAPKLLSELKRKYKNPDGITFLFCGRCVYNKGVTFLLEAWEKHIKRYPKDNIIILGGGDLVDYLKEKYKIENSIHIIGGVEYSEVYKYYAIADVFILPTLQDNWSLVIPEAMSCGLPVATSIYNGCYPELIQKDVNGIVFDTLKQDSLIDTLSYFHSCDLKAMGEHSKEIEKSYNTENCALREYNGIISILKNKGL